MFKVICICALSVASSLAQPQNVNEAAAELTAVGQDAKGLLTRTVKTAFNLIPSGDAVSEAINRSPAAFAPYYYTGPDGQTYAAQNPGAAPSAPAPYYYTGPDGKAYATQTQAAAPGAYYQYYLDANGQVVVAPAAPAAPAAPTSPYAPDVKPITAEDRQVLATFLRVTADIIAEGTFEKAQVKMLIGFLDGLLDE